jgi:hypothetical protein
MAAFETHIPNPHPRGTPLFWFDGTYQSMHSNLLERKHSVFKHLLTYKNISKNLLVFPTNNNVFINLSLSSPSKMSDCGSFCLTLRARLYACSEDLQLRLEGVL